MKTGLLKAGFFLNKLIPAKPFTFNNLSLEILFSLIPPKAIKSILFPSVNALNLQISKNFLFFFTKKIGAKNIVLHF